MLTSLAIGLISINLVYFCRETVYQRRCQTFVQRAALTIQTVAAPRNALVRLRVIEENMDFALVAQFLPIKDLFMYRVRTRRGGVVLGVLAALCPLGCGSACRRWYTPTPRSAGRAAQVGYVEVLGNLLGGHVHLVVDPVHELRLLDLRIHVENAAPQAIEVHSAGSSYHGHGKLDEQV